MRECTIIPVAFIDKVVVIEVQAPGTIHGTITIIATHGTKLRLKAIIVKLEITKMKGGV
jgi:hypothetical protein